jgi:LacI family transcriptional regulator
MTETAPKKRTRKKAPSGNARLADVAQAANVSTATVSRVLNNNPTVDSEIRQHVLKVIADLNWVPNASAKALAVNRTRTIGTVIPTLDHQNFARLVERLETTLTNVGYKILLGCSQYDAASEIRQVRTMVERGADAVIVVGNSQSNELHDFVEAQGVPCIMLYTPVGATVRGHAVPFDNYGAARAAADYLLELGHTRFGMLGHSVSVNDRLSARMRGTLDALGARGLSVRSDQVANSGSWKIADGVVGFRAIMSTPSPPTALVCSNDYVAVGCLIEAASMGIDVPREVSVIGFDDIDLAAMIRPRLTTLRIPDAQVGEVTARYIVDLLEGRDPPMPAIPPARLVVRGSTAPPRN